MSDRSSAVPVVVAARGGSGDRRAGRFTDYSNETVAQCVATMHRAMGLKPVPATVTPASTAPGPSGCQIKGNVSGNGRIYHLPGSDSYTRTKVDESKGERWFCSEEQARAAGWRARKR